MRFNYEVDEVHAAKFREWFATRGGVLVWTNAEIAGGHPAELCTPATSPDGIPTTSPGWRYTSGEPIDVASLKVAKFKVLTTFRGRAKSHFWGPGLADATEGKAAKLCAKLANGKAEFRYTIDWPFAIVEIGTYEIIAWEAFNTLEVATHASTSP